MPSNRAPSNATPRPPAIRVGRLDTADRVRRELARVYKDARCRRIEAGDASKLASVLGLIVRIVETSDFERRIDALEARIADRPSRRAA